MILQNKIVKLIERAISNTYEIKETLREIVYIAKPADSFHFFSNIALRLSKKLKDSPLNIAKTLKNFIEKESNNIISVEIGGPGFLNFIIKDREINNHLKDSLQALVKAKEKKLCYLEYISGNPTGPLHLGHLRIGLASKLYGNLLEFQGIKVYKDYLLNDAGNQMNTLLFTISKMLFLGDAVDKKGLTYYSSLLDSLVKDLKKEAELIKDLEDEKGFLLKDVMGTNSLNRVKAYIVDYFKNDAIKDMNIIGIKTTDLNFTSETELIKKNVQDNIVKKMINSNIAEWKDNALWLKTTNEDDEKNRVLIKSNGDRTYVFTDIIYHLHKYEIIKEKNGEIVNFWGSDQYGNESTLSKGLKLLGENHNKLKVVFMQLIQLKRNQQVVRMSKRKGDIVNIKDLPKLLSVDTMIHYILSKSLDTTLAIDVGEISKQDKSNPMYYLQYTYARIAQLLKRARNDGYNPTFQKSEKTSNREKKLVILALDSQRIILEVTESKELHKIYQHLISICELYHSYYQNEHILSKDCLKKQIEHRLYLNKFIQKIIKDLFLILGIEPLDFMD